ncbi:MAG: hypothetical protein QXU81_07555 [Candidatus Bathyarchaeia archaeon]
MELPLITSEDKVIKDFGQSLMYAIRLYKYWISRGELKEEAMKKTVDYVAYILKSSLPITFLAYDKLMEVLSDSKIIIEMLIEELQKVKIERSFETRGEKREETAGKRYNQYLLPVYTHEADLPPRAHRGIIDLGPIFGINFGLRFNYVYGEPFVFERPHSHDFDQLLVFLGPPENVSNFDAEIEIALGDEGERYPITSNTSVYIPKGLTHTPIYFKRIGKPLVFLNMIFGAGYQRK